MKAFYECTFIVNPGLDDAQTEATAKAVEETIVKNGGQIVSIDHIGRRRLAYPIAKKHNGYYICIEFESEGRSIEKVDRHLKLDENIMRYLTLKLDTRELAAKRARSTAGAVVPDAAPAADAGKPADAPKAAEAPKSAEEPKAAEEPKVAEAVVDAAADGGAASAQ